ncbi:hypothetical protein niasHS_014012 [Heterodera schachtii]|uniref:Uncharacterized protein n=1 Tax=Heterodera schachtii TaxID=97005 RepID=A0ABD2IPH4_HETSC
MGGEKGPPKAEGEGGSLNWPIVGIIRELASRAKELIDEESLLSEQIRLRQAQSEQLNAGLPTLSKERRRRLEETLQLYDLHREIDDLLQWIADKIVRHRTAQLMHQIFLEDAQDADGNNNSDGRQTISGVDPTTLEEEELKQMCAEHVLEKKRLEQKCADLEQKCAEHVLERKRLEQLCAEHVLEKKRLEQLCAAADLEKKRLEQKCAELVLEQTRSQQVSLPQHFGNLLLSVLGGPAARQLFLKVMRVGIEELREFLRSRRSD